MASFVSHHSYYGGEFQTNLPWVATRSSVVTPLLQRDDGYSTKSTLLHGAAADGNTDQVTAMLRFGAKVNARGLNGMTPLHYAAENGHLDTVRALVMMGANPNVSGDAGATPIHLAAHKGYAFVIEILARHGAMVDVRMKDKRTPLHLAVEQDHPHAVVTLIRAGADPNALDVDKCTPLHLAACNNSLMGAEALLRFCTPPPVSYARLMSSAFPAFVPPTIVDVHANDRFGYTALEIAVDRDYHALSQLLCKYGAQYYM